MGGRGDATYSTLPHISCFDSLYITYTKLCDNTNFLPSVLSSSSTDIWVVVISDENAFGTTADEQ